MASWLRIINRHTGKAGDPCGLRLNGERGRVSVCDAPQGWWSAYWQVVLADDGYVRIVLRHTGIAGDPVGGLRLHAQRGKVSVGDAPDGWWSALWKLELVDDEWYRIVLRHTGIAGDPVGGLRLHAQMGKVSVRDAPDGWWSACWKFCTIPNIAFTPTIYPDRKSCVMSFCGENKSGWDKLVARAAVGGLNSACVFLPLGDPNHGKHVVGEAGNLAAGGPCLCHTLYREVQQWGCYWFGGPGLWKENADRVKALGQDMIVFTKRPPEPEEEMKLRSLNFHDLPKYTHRHPILGGSQIAEVAYLNMITQGTNINIWFRSADVPDCELFKDLLAP
mmetsp:Transcript_89183/g.277265  ORF Transcript_89183/g.277265 Transcript_89183/m.277265 type:complete len:333 (-) Transcript_89183:89-1087(-)